MCEFCEGNKPLNPVIDGNLNGNYVSSGTMGIEEGDRLVSSSMIMWREGATIPPATFWVKISFFPICGRKLDQNTDIFSDKTRGSRDLTDSVSRPSYYRDGGKCELIKVIQDWGLSFCLGNVLKYLRRAGRKPGNSRLQDLGKAKQYLEFEIAKEKERADES